MVWGILVLSVVCLAINGYYTRKLLDYRWREQVLDLAPVLGATAVMAMAMISHLFLKFKSTGAWFLLLNLTNPLTLVAGADGRRVTVYGSIAGLSRMSTYVEFRCPSLFLFLVMALKDRTEGNAMI